VLAHSISARFELVTPGFASGARPEDFAELRTEAMIGQLRRWWWAQAVLDEAFQGPKGFDVGKATTFADVLFGAAGSEDGASDGTGQGAFLIMLRESTVAPMSKSTGLEDLFGPLWRRRSQWLWTAPPNTRPSFTVAFMLRPSRIRTSKHNDASLTLGLRRALALWGLLGGMGAGQRRGFGSVQLVEMTVAGGDEPSWMPPRTIAEYLARLAETLPGQLGSRGTPQEFGSFAAAGTPPASMWIAQLPNCGDGKAALDTIVLQLRNLKTDIVSNQPTLTINNIIDLFSNQGNPRQRKPSPFHLHVARIDSSIGLILSVLPRADCYPPARAAWITGEAQAVMSLAERLHMTQVAPPPTMVGR
jgi:hypothetical protein